MEGTAVQWPVSDVDDLECSVETDPVALKKQDIRNNLEYDEYINMRGQWAWPNEEKKLTPINNDILGHLVARLRNLVNPLGGKPAESLFPFFRLKACVLGKLCSGKTSCLAKIAQAHGFHVLSVQELVNNALNSYKNRGMATEKEQQLSAGKENPKVDVTSLRVLSTQVLNVQEAEKAMVEGNELPFELLVKLVIRAIQKLPANSGWILDGFPLNVKQAHLLEKALGGGVEGGECVVTNSQTDLAVNPDPPNASPPPPPALDLALLLDASDECAVSRAVNLSYATATNSTPEYRYMSQIPHKITDFNKTWPKLEEWFEAKQKILIRVDANVDEEALFNRVESVLLKVQRPLPDVVDTLPDEVVVSNEGIPPPQELSRTTSSSSSSSQESTVNLKSSVSVKNPQTEKENNVTIPMCAVILAVSRMTSLMNKSSASYFDKPLALGIAEALHLHWKNVCEMYVNNVKAVLQKLRLENMLINRHFLHMKEEFKDFLGRQDLRQEFVSYWQKDFNAVADDMRSDEETKAELHVRLYELCENLRKICEKRKAENEQERAAVMGDGWLSDHTALILNYHLILIQVELDRFQDTFCILKTYHLGVTNKPLLNPLSNLTTISLQDTPITPDLETQFQQIEQNELQKKLLDDYDEAIAAINRLLLTAGPQMKVVTKSALKTQEKPLDADKGSKKAQSEKIKESAIVLPTATSLVSPEVQPTHSKMSKYNKALSHEEEATKVRITLVKFHGLNLLDCIQENAEQTFCFMGEWLNEGFQNEMKSILELAEVVSHHIESGAQLLNELAFDLTHFSVNGDYHMVALAPPPPRPPSLEQPSQSTFSIIQLGSLCQQFRHIAPNGLLTCLEFGNCLKDILTTNRSRNTLPETWVTMTETKLMEIVASLKDKHDLVDWRRFLLGCALPWPSPSVTQLLDALRHLKAADFESKGYISEGQYLQTHLWFPQDTVVETPEDPSKPLPYDRLSNLFKFFFWMFADHSFNPSRLNYTSMLLYLSADPNPKQGFVRALSVVVGQCLEKTSSTQLVKSMPSLDKVPEFSSVSVPALLTVLGHSSSIKDSRSKYTKLVGVYKELGYGPEDSITFSLLSTHSFIQHLMETSTQHQLVNIYHLLNNGKDQSV